MTRDEIPPNPVIREVPILDHGGCMARKYKNGMWDAVDGLTFSISPGFDSLEELKTWLANEEARMTNS